MRKRGNLLRTEKRKKIFYVLASIVVFFTTYALVLPAITVDEQTAFEDPAISNETLNEETINELETVADPFVIEAEREEALNNPSAEETVAQTGEDAVATENETAAEEEKAEVLYFKDESTSIKVYVEAPLEAFPEGTTMKVTPISSDKVFDKVNDALDNKAKRVEAVDITFYDKDGNEIEPACEIKVSLKSDLIKDSKDTTIVHIDDNGKGTVVEQSDEATKDDEVKFESKDFSTYVVVVTTEVITADGDEYTISVTYDSDLLPENVSLQAEELTEGADFDAYKAAIEEELGTELDYIRLFDITIVDKNGNKVQPDDSVKVTIRLNDLDEEREMKAIHIPDEGDMEVIDEVKVETVNENGETATEVSFDAEGFSVYAVVEGEGGPEARVTVNFYGTDLTRPVATYYVKNSDVLKSSIDPATHTQEQLDSYSYIDDIVVDPGVGQNGVPSGQVFLGWSMDDLMKPNGTRYTDTDNYVGADYKVDTVPLTVERVREILVDIDIHEGDIINIYAMIFKYYNVTYFGDKATGEINTNVSLGTDTVYLLTSDTNANYTVSQSYSADAHQNFKGWKPTEETASKINAVQGEDLVPLDVYANGTKTVITGDITLYVDAPRGNWLVYNANARGATFNAPQFYLANETTVIAPTATVDSMERNGYTLEVRADGEPGWYTLKPEYYDDKGEPLDSVPKDENGYFIISDTYFEPFTFGGLLEDNLQIYAKWVAKTTANYTIIFHKQNIDRTGYEMAGSFVGTGAVGTQIPFTFVNNTDEDYITDAGERNGHYTGFCLNHSQTNDLGTLQMTTGYTTDAQGNEVPIKENISIPTITPEGDAVLNIYYDRIVYYFRFYYYRQNGNNQYSYAQNSNEYTGNGVYGVATWSSFGNNNRPTQTYGTDMTASVESYTAHYFVLKAYYGQEIASLWPQYSELGTVGGNQAVSFVMMNGTGLKKKINTAGTGTGTGSDTIKGTIQVMDEMILGKTNDANGNFVVIRYNTRNEWRYHIFYEQVDGEDYSSYLVHDFEFNGKLYYEDHIYNSRSTNTYVDKQTAPQFSGYEYIGLSNRTGQNGGDHQNNARWQTTENGTTYYHVRFYYKRDVYPITFYDGNYVTGNTENGSTDHNRASQLIKDKDTSGSYIMKETINVAHGAQIPDSVKNYVPPIQPGEEGYVFEGWYADEACSPGTEYTFTTMPVGGITVYAKWRQIRYRVFLHSEAYMLDANGRPIIEDGKYVYDPSLYWGSATQQMSFGIAYGGKVSLPDGTRDEYEFLGWFLDKAGTQLFTASTQLNEETVPASPAYNKEIDFTDTLDKNGNVDYSEGDPYNSDVGRYWVTRKLELYGKWRQIIVGAEGIGVQYVAGELGNESTLPTDELLYKDKAGAIAQPACKPVNETKYQFLYWVVQRYDKTLGDYVDAIDENGDPVICFPGDSFICNVESAKKVENADSTPENPKYTYTIQLRAEYGLKDVEKPTHIDWYPNYGDNYTIARETNLQINEPAQIIAAPERTGYKFLGWARIPTSVSKSHEVEGSSNAQADVLSLTENDLYLTYHEAVGSNPAYFTVKYNNTDKTVTHVAADEALQYHDMYAVWKALPNLYVFKTDETGSTYIDLAHFRLTVGNTAVDPKLGGTKNASDNSWIMTDGEEGLFYVGLSNGTYTLTETAAPSGYIITSATTYIYISDGKMYSDAAHSNMLSKDSDGNYVMTVQNKTGTPLPVTGGSGTSKFKILGSIFIVGSAMYEYSLRRKERRLNK